MKKVYIAITALLVLSACKDGKQVLVGETGELACDKVYLCEVENEYRSIHRVVDSATVVDGKFSFVMENVKPELYFIGDNARHGGYFFWEGGKNELSPESITDEEIVWKVSGSSLDEQYRKFITEKDQVTRKKTQDSLTVLFYKARETGDTTEMKRIKNESIPYYEAAREKEGELVDKYVGANRDNIFGIYLYYSKKFQHKDFPTATAIAAEKEYVSGFGKAAVESRYASRIADRLTEYENCAIGHEAPEITGLDTLGQPVRLSDFRGKYVLVDFWNSYCHWCREETPYLLKVLDRFKDQNFTILGVSSDRITDKWTEAIHQDKSYWNHLMLEKGDKIMDRYCIKGIPHIILVGPDGVILEKELRGDEISAIIARHIKE